MAASSIHRKRMHECGVLGEIEAFLSSEMREPAMYDLLKIAALLHQLAFDEKIAADIRKAGFEDRLRTFPTLYDDPTLKKVVNGALWQLKPLSEKQAEVKEIKKDEFGSEEKNDQRRLRVMISYN